MQEKRTHLLLQLAKGYDTPASLKGPHGFHYDWEKGAWLDDHSGQYYAFSSKRRPPETKKSDVETGEDQKGE